MLCEECGERDAVLTVSVLADGGRTTRHLCRECMVRLNPAMNAGNFRNLLSSLMTAIAGNRPEPQAQAEEEKPSIPPEEDISCPRCGMSLSRFMAGGHLGCAGCYDTFRTQLQPMLLQIHGRTQHAGRRPLDSRTEQSARNRREQLTQLMQQAVAVEDFETAAQLRDQLRAMAAEEAKA